MEKLISFEIMQNMCDDRYFEDRGMCHFFIKCKKGIPFCNERVCPVWNNLKIPAPSVMSLREINGVINGNG